ncbi:MAG: DUF2149 domain-containing protein [Planctomycetes bacterium]|nr:DUF2149 domain-containing protein [Planctomycetota bacterium]
MVFAVAVLLTAVGAGSASTVAGDAVDDATRSIDARLRAAEDELSGHGERLGVAYRLTSGEIVYVPEDDGESGAAAR